MVRLIRAAVYASKLFEMSFGWTSGRSSYSNTILVIAGMNIHFGRFYIISIITTAFFESFLYQSLEQLTIELLCSKTTA